MLRSVELRMHDKNVISKELVETRGNFLNGLYIFCLFLCAFVVAWVFIICRHKRYGVFSSNRQIQKFLDEIVATSIFIQHFKIQYDIFLVSSCIAALAFIRHKIYSKCEEKKPQKFFNFFFLFLFSTEYTQNNIYDNLPNIIAQSIHTSHKIHENMMTLSRSRCSVVCCCFVSEFRTFSIILFLFFEWKFRTNKIIFIGKLKEDEKWMTIWLYYIVKNTDNGSSKIKLWLVSFKLPKRFLFLRDEKKSFW